MGIPLRVHAHDMSFLRMHLSPNEKRTSRQVLWCAFPLILHLSICETSAALIYIYVYIYTSPTWEPTAYTFLIVVPNSNFANRCLSQT